jgi:hypothetical protein
MLEELFTCNRSRAIYKVKEQTSRQTYRLDLPASRVGLYAVIVKIALFLKEYELERTGLKLVLPLVGPCVTRDLKMPKVVNWTIL